MLKPHFFETYSHNFRELLTANVAVAELCRCNDHLLALVALQKGAMWLLVACVSLAKCCLPLIP